ncbi:hypothetical protein F442_00220 [Phytophthora nicotianae P10297]|uniref:Uncharacterized protein n=1 Tax=Phytophthora nicotianae P10297 TaxID=1317064 RepID=W3A6J3_PHYNI|nr:hypothetical protein F442_00220 [Phytophthora nicotianae P10297]
MDTELKRQAAVETGLACHLRPRRADATRFQLFGELCRSEAQSWKNFFEKSRQVICLHRAFPLATKTRSSAQASDVQTVCRSKAVADQTGFRFLAGESFERKAGWGESSASEHASASPARNLSD